MKKGVAIAVVLSVLILSLGFASANAFSDIWNKLFAGNVQMEFGDDVGSSCGDRWCQPGVENCRTCSGDCGGCRAGSSIKCADSDGGLKYGIKGRINPDAISSVGNPIPEDYCDASNPNVPPVLVEVYCESEQAKWKGYQCEDEGKICREGRCVQKTNSNSCEDPDGRDYNVQGSTWVNGFGVGTAFGYDFCEQDGRLREYYCEAGEPKSEVVNCPSGKICSSSEGRCVSSQTSQKDTETICTDTDGNDFGQAGTLTVASGSVFHDGCNNAETATREYYCVGGDEFGKYGNRYTFRDHLCPDNLPRCRINTCVSGGLLGEKCSNVLKCNSGLECKNGKCSSVVTDPSNNDANDNTRCTDTDGYDLGQAGTLTMIGGSVLNDECNNAETATREYYCVGSGDKSGKTGTQHAFKDIMCPTNTPRCRINTCVSGGLLGEKCNNNLKCNSGLECKNWKCAVPKATTSTCTKSGGKNYDVKGTISPSATSSIGNPIAEDYCDISSGQAVLVETYCDGASPKWEAHTCEEGKVCQEGRCVLESDKKWCNDSDGGLNYGVKSRCTDSLGHDIDDECISGGEGAGQLKEATCGDGKDSGLLCQNARECACQINAYACPNGCSDGACLPDTSTICTDTEKVVTSPDVFGTVNYQGKDYNDSCINTTALKDYTCNTIYGLDYITYTCPNGCSDGVCLSDSLMFSYTAGDRYFMADRFDYSVGLREYYVLKFDDFKNETTFEFPDRFTEMTSLFVLENGSWKNVCNGVSSLSGYNTCIIGGIVIRVNSIYYLNKYVRISANAEPNFDGSVSFDGPFSGDPTTCIDSDGGLNLGVSGDCRDPSAFMSDGCSNTLAGNAVHTEVFCADSYNKDEVKCRAITSSCDEGYSCRDNNCVPSLDADGGAKSTGEGGTPGSMTTCGDVPIRLYDKECEGNDLYNKNCYILGFFDTEGLSCSEDCKFNTNLCTKSVTPSSTESIRLMYDNAKGTDINNYKSEFTCNGCFVMDIQATASTGFSSGVTSNVPICYGEGYRKIISKTGPFLREGNYCENGVFTSMKKGGESCSKGVECKSNNCKNNGKCANWAWVGW